MQNKILVLLLLLTTNSFAHEGHHPAPHTQEQKKIDAPLKTQEVYANIQEGYNKNIRPIFDQKCAACHAKGAELPWYASVPVVGWVINSDIKNAQKHLEISKGFPFNGHGTPKEDLKAIQEEVADADMPTPLYTVFHWEKRLTPEEQKIIVEWAEKSQKEL